MKKYVGLFFRLCVYLGLVVVCITLFSLASSFIPHLGRLDREVAQLVDQSLMLISVGLPAWWLLRRGGGRPCLALGLTWNGRGALEGTVCALLIYAAGFGINLLVGSVEVVGWQLCFSQLLLSWVLMLLVAFTEEIMVRGVILGQMLQAGVNRYAALLLSSLLFSSLHLFNPNFSWLPFANIVLAGLLLGATYIYTRNLWFAISLHLFWNWLQGPVLGFPVSGNTLTGSVLTLNLPQPDGWNGGAFGFEGSWLCLVIQVVAILSILRVASTRCDRAQYQA